MFFSESVDILLIRGNTDWQAVSLRSIKHSKMASTHSFPLFSSLPKERRLMKS